MEEIKDLKLNEKMREDLKLFSETYKKGMDKIGVSIDIDELKKLINEIAISFYNSQETTGTFKVSQVKKEFNVILNNYEKNGKERNDFLLLHEFTHLSSKFNKAYSTDINKKKDEFENYTSIQNNSDLSGWDAAWGLTAIEETIAQWCAERAYEALNNKDINIRDEEHTILNNKVKIKTDFTNYGKKKDEYAPLERYVEDFAIDLGFDDMRDFVNSMVTGKANLFDMISEENIERLGYIGILCEGIYQENGFENCGLPETDIPKAIAYLDEKRANKNFPSESVAGSNAKNTKTAKAAEAVESTKNSKDTEITLEKAVINAMKSGTTIEDLTNEQSNAKHINEQGKEENEISMDGE